MIYCNVHDVIYRVLTVHGYMDKIVPAEEAMEFDKFIPNNKVLIVEGTDHNKLPKTEKTEPNRTGSIGF